MNANTIRVLRLCVMLLLLAVAKPARAQNRAIDSGRNDVVYLAPATQPYQSLALGNGKLGAAVWNDGGMTYQLNHGEFFVDKDYENLISSGRVDLKLPVEWMQNLGEERLSLDEGAITTKFKTANIRSWMVEGLDVLAVEITSDQVLPEVAVDVSIWKGAERPTPVLHADAGAVGVTTVGNPAVIASTILVRIAEGTATAAKFDDLRVRLTIPAQNRKAITIWVACPVVIGTAIDAEKSLKEAQSLIDQAQRKGATLLWQEHVAYWHNFWSKSMLLMHSPDGFADYVENLYYLHLYWTASSSRGKYPTKFNDANFLCFRDARGWGGQYWYQNTREIYWPLLAAGHPELWRPFIDLYWNALPAFRELAKQMGASGAAVEETMHVSGLGDKLGNPYTHLYLTTGTEVAHQFYQYYLFTQEEAFLRERVYPFMKEVIEFHLNFVNKEADGKYHVYPSDARETWWWVKDSTPDLTALRATLPILIATSEKLGVDNAERTHWMEVLENLAPYSRDPQDGRLLPATFLEEYPPTRFAKAEALYTPERRTKLSKRNPFNSENPEIEPVYPWGLIGLDSPADELNTMRLTLTKRVNSSWGNGWEWGGVSAARLGMAEEVVRMMQTYAAHNQQFPAGYSRTPGITWKEGGDAINQDTGFDATGVFATAVSEMQFQSYQGKIWVYPAWPKGWEGEFTLNADGGFIVSSQIAADGTIPFVNILSQHGGKLQLANPWKNTARISVGDKTVSDANKDWIIVDTRVGDRVSIKPEASSGSVTQIEVAKCMGPKWSVRLGPDDTAEAYMKRSSFGMLGLTREGLCPAVLAIQKALAEKPVAK